MFWVQLRGRIRISNSCGHLTNKPSIVGLEQGEGLVIQTLNPLKTFAWEKFLEVFEAWALLRSWVKVTIWGSVCELC